MSNWLSDEMPLLKSIPLTLLCGVMCALALPNWYITPFFFIGFSVFYIFLCHAPGTFRRGFILGWAFSFAYYVLGLYWIGNALMVEGNSFAWAWPLAVCALPALLACFNALACGLARRYFDLKSLHGFLGFVGLYGLFEYLRGHLFTGFPWNLHGMIWADHLLILQTVLRTGDIYLLSLLTTLTGAVFGFIFIARSKINFAFAAAILIGFAAWGIVSNHQNKGSPSALVQDENTTTIRIVQPNIAQHEKWDRNKMRDHFEKLLTMSKPQGNESSTTLIIWPETATSYGFLNNAAARDMITETLRTYNGKAYLITGALLREDDGSGISNSIITIDQNGGIIQRYDKSHLVPFGEYIPFHKWIPFETITQFSGFLKGDGPTALPLPDGFSFSPLICYEVIFPGHVTNPDTQPNVIINVTNDGWYGDSAGPYQHFAMARMRAIEENLPLIRAANTGISGLISNTGRIKNIADLGDEAVIMTTLGQNNNQTNEITQSHFQHSIVLWLIAILIIYSIFGKWIYCKYRKQLLKNTPDIP